MCTQEIIAELAHLTKPELEVVDAQLQKLVTAQKQCGKSRADALTELAGAAQGLPADLAENHDYYLHGK